MPCEQQELPKIKYECRDSSIFEEAIIVTEGKKHIMLKHYFCYTQKSESKTQMIRTILKTFIL